RLEQLIDHTSTLFEPPTEFVVPGESTLAAQLDVARTVTRRAERSALGVDGVGAQVLAYLNRLSDLLWTLARWVEGESLTARPASPQPTETDAARPPTGTEGATTDG
ncbi:MAG: ATP:cob(I)alamin adenosyltransferase, partial [Microthrixaceae bacterium]|nr:ATP:cob(I)alamin adenosyltransferase [Microthrixaceae bacterium]